jgi:hypothetical protein
MLSVYIDEVKRSGMWLIPSRLNEMPKLPGPYSRICLRTFPDSQRENTAFAMKNRYLLDRLSECKGCRPEALHVVGGRTRNRMLNQLLANPTGPADHRWTDRGVRCRELPHSVKGNGEMGSLEEGKAVVRSSFSFKPMRPARATFWRIVMTDTSKSSAACPRK